MPRLLLIRHGQASYGADDYDELSPLGCRQAALLGRWLADCRLSPARIVSGSLRRHRQTADHCLAAMAAHAPPPPQRHEDTGLDEYDNDGILGVHLPELLEPDARRRHFAAQPDPVRASRELFFTSMQRWIDCTTPGPYRELWPAFVARGLAACRQAADGLPEDATVLIFTSGGVIAALLHGLLELAPRTALELNWTLANTGLTAVQIRGERLRLASLNGVPHLERETATGLVTYR